MNFYTAAQEKLRQLNLSPEMKEVVTDFLSEFPAAFPVFNGSVLHGKGCVQMKWKTPDISVWVYDSNFATIYASGVCIGSGPFKQVVLKTVQTMNYKPTPPTPPTATKSPTFSEQVMIALEEMYFGQAMMNRMAPFLVQFPPNTPTCAVSSSVNMVRLSWTNNEKWLRLTIDNVLTVERSDDFSETYDWLSYANYVAPSMEWLYPSTKVPAPEDEARPLVAGLPEAPLKAVQAVEFFTPEEVAVLKELAQLSSSLFRFREWWSEKELEEINGAIEIARNRLLMRPGKRLWEEIKKEGESESV